MKTMCKSVVRWTLIGGLAVAGITVLIGPKRVVAVFDDIQTRAEIAVDDYIDINEAVALRRQLQSLAEAYPDRIKDLRKELARVEAETQRFHREADVARRVVDMTDADLQALASRVHDAEASGVQKVSLMAKGSTVGLEKAYREGRRIRTIRDTYRDRLASDEQQLVLLQTQQTRLEDLLETLEREYADYRAQAWQLDRQIDAIERNERLIKLTEQQQQVLSRFETPGTQAGLRQIEDQLAQMRAVQEGTLQSLAHVDQAQDYEAIAASAHGAAGAALSTDPFAEFIPTSITDVSH